MNHELALLIVGFAAGSVWMLLTSLLLEEKTPIAGKEKAPFQEEG